MLWLVTWPAKGNHVSSQESVCVCCAQKAPAESSGLPDRCTNTFGDKREVRNSLSDGCNPLNSATDKEKASISLISFLAVECLIF